MRNKLMVILASGAVLLAATTQAADPPATWDGLVQVKSKRLDLVYIQPGAEFGEYTKVMIDPVEVSFAKNWRRDYNNASRSMSGNVSESELQRTITEAAGAAGDIMADAWTKGGFQVVTVPGADVMRIKSGVLNISVSAPDVATGRTRSFAPEAGYATYFIEARDSESGALLGRAVDKQIVGDYLNAWRTRGSNRADFRDEMKRWAEISVRGITELKTAARPAP
jgi:hypothetical protein